MKKNYKILLFGAFPILLLFTVKVIGKSFSQNNTDRSPSNQAETVHVFKDSNTSPKTQIILTTNFNTH